jgi:hypothetical protein
MVYERGLGLLQYAASFGTPTLGAQPVSDPAPGPSASAPLVQELFPRSTPTLGGAIGNQVTWMLVNTPLPGTDDKQDTLSLFFNAQAVTNVDLTTGQCAAPGGQFLIGAIKTFF